MMDAAELPAVMPRHLLDLFNAWTPGTLRTRILVDNAARLYRYE